jgi:hypothetical protein
MRKVLRAKRLRVQLVAHLILAGAAPQGHRLLVANCIMNNLNSVVPVVCGIQAPGTRA